MRLRLIAEAGRPSLYRSGLNKADAVKIGRKMEQRIIDSMSIYGLDITPATVAQDMFDKIDAWWDRSGEVVPIQIKYRETGNDIVFEVLKDYDRGTPGRDVTGKAEVIAVLNSSGDTIYMVDFDEAVGIVRQMQDEVDKVGFDNNGNFNMDGAMLRIRYSPQSDTHKLLAYVPISMLQLIEPPIPMRA